MFRHRNRVRVSFDSGKQLITKQSHKKECDIHNILRQYQRTGIITHVSSARPTFSELPADVDYQQSLNLIIQAETAFNGLPSKVRDYFGNDPARFLSAFQDASQAEKLRELGLLESVRASPPVEGGKGADTASGAA